VLQLVGIDEDGKVIKLELDDDDDDDMKRKS